MKCGRCGTDAEIREYRTFRYYWCNKCRDEAAPPTAAQGPVVAMSAEPLVACLWCGTLGSHPCNAFNPKTLGDGSMLVEQQLWLPLSRRDYEC
jgi:hypothetical protein